MPFFQEGSTLPPWLLDSLAEATAAKEAANEEPAVPTITLSSDDSGSSGTTDDVIINHFFSNLNLIYAL